MKSTYNFDELKNNCETLGIELLGTEKNWPEQDGVILSYILSEGCLPHGINILEVLQTVGSITSDQLRKISLLIFTLHSVNLLNSKNYILHSLLDAFLPGFISLKQPDNPVDTIRIKDSIDKRGDLLYRILSEKEIFNKLKKLSDANISLQLDYSDTDKPLQVSLVLLDTNFTDYFGEQISRTVAIPLAKDLKLFQAEDIIDAPQILKTLQMHVDYVSFMVNGVPDKSYFTLNWGKLIEQTNPAKPDTSLSRTNNFPVFVFKDILTTLYNYFSLIDIDNRPLNTLHTVTKNVDEIPGKNRVEISKAFNQLLFGKDEKDVGDVLSSTGSQRPNELKETIENGTTIEALQALKITCSKIIRLEHEKYSVFHGQIEETFINYNMLNSGLTGCLRVMFPKLKITAGHNSGLAAQRDTFNRLHEFIYKSINDRDFLCMLKKYKTDLFV